jgi:predicted DNA-binding protein
MPKKKPGYHNVSVRMTDEQHEQLARLAKEDSRDKGPYLLSLLVEKIKKGGDPCKH